MKPRVYIETSVISYLTAKPSADIIASARQMITAQWWESERQHYELLISEFVVQEASMGNKTAAKLRLNALLDVPLLQADDKKTDALARALIRAKALPQSAWLDAQHIAISAVGGVQYLLTWSFKHIANAKQIEVIIRACHKTGYNLPTILTPDAMLQIKRGAN